MLKRIMHSRIIASFIAFMLAAPCCFLLIGGCGKNNPAAPETTVTLKGNQAFRAAAVAAYQAVGAGVSYPLKALQIASPTGSMLRNMSGTNSLSKSPGSIKTAGSAKLFKYIPGLNLYLTGGTEGLHVLELLFSIDPAGTQPAGNVSVTLPEGVTILTDSTVIYSSFPLSSTIDIAITEGNLPCTGNLVSKFIDKTGANTLTGTNTLTKDNVVFSLNLSLDTIGVSGSITITESGASIQATNVHGKLLGPLTCDVTVNPYGWTGTGTLNLMTGAVTLTVNMGTGTSTAASDSLGNLTVNYADGTPEIVVNALSAGLTATTDTTTGIPAAITTTTGSSQSANVNTAFTAPLVVTVKNKSGNPVSGATVTFNAPSSGQSCTFSGGAASITATTNAQGQAQANITANATAGSYSVTASVSGVAAKAAFSLTNNSTVVFGTLTDTDGNVYKTVKIGNQEWMAENLRVTKYNDGSPIPLDTSTATWGKDSATGSRDTTPKYCFYNNTTNTDSIKKYGALYNWYIVSPANPRKIAPAGWHVPSDSEWTVLSTFLGGDSVAGGALKSTGFSMVPAGCRTGNRASIGNGEFIQMGDYAEWWSATEIFTSFAMYCWIMEDDAHLYLDDISLGCDEGSGYSVRLLKDN
jgi:uncharacterized protein (TIGR02145 family)